MTTYKPYRNVCNNVFKKCKQCYERNLLNKTKNYSKRLWTTIKHISHLKTPNTIPSN